LNFLNRVVRPVFKYATNWDYRKGIVGSLKEKFGDERVKVDKYNSGSMYVKVTTRDPTQR